MEILVYISANKECYLGGDPLALYIPEEAERQRVLGDLGKALKADAVQLGNGDYVLMRKMQ